MQSWNDRVSSAESSTRQRPDRRIWGVRGRAKLSRRNVQLQDRYQISETKDFILAYIHSAVRQISRTFGCCFFVCLFVVVVLYRFEGKEKQFVFSSLFYRKSVKHVKDGR